MYACVHVCGCKLTCFTIDNNHAYHLLTSWQRHSSLFWHVAASATKHKEIFISKSYVHLDIVLNNYMSLIFFMIWAPDMDA